KSTTLAAMLGHVNMTKKCHILTLEEPIEYLHMHGEAMINQREIHEDTLSFANALRAALREDPDIILVGEMRDLDTISTAITAAETGHLVLSTLHTSSAADTVNRIIDVYPPHQQDQIRVQLATCLVAVICQTLVQRIGGGRCAAFEIMISNDAIRNNIREGKTYQIDSTIATSLQSGMCPLDFYLAELVKRNMITRDTALQRSRNPEDVIIRILFVSKRCRRHEIRSVVIHYHTKRSVSIICYINAHEDSPVEFRHDEIRRGVELYHLP
ncbi:MAG: Flp pilus assembly complex ATPase component TadA, partial [Clostridiales bacterium]|nr:Flp pilus assembly complex ATPase component TadA [Clostridiales bacterium]